MILIGSPDHGRRIADLAGSDFDVTKNPVISRVDRGGHFMGGVFYSDFTGVSIRGHMAGLAPNWPTPTFLWMAFDYPFNQLGVKTLLITVPSTNLRAMQINRRLGFKEIYRIPDAIPDGDIVMMSMWPEECRWITRPKEVVHEMV